MSVFATIEEAIEEIKKGNIVIVVDDEDRENEGDMVLAAEKVTAENINFLTKHARGLICAPLTHERSRELDLQPMVQHNTCQYGTAFTVSVDYTTGTTTGISAFDRTATIRALVVATGACIAHMLNHPPDANILLGPDSQSTATDEDPRTWWRRTFDQAEERSNAP